MIGVFQNGHAVGMLVLGLGFCSSIFVLIRQKSAHLTFLETIRKALQPTYLSLALLAASLAFIVANSVVVLNGTTSLPHHGYYMLRMPLIMRAGNYVSFNTPSILKDKFPGISFVKRIVGVPGDEVRTTGNTVCVNGQCRTLQKELIAAGFKPLESGILDEGQYLVFGDTEDSLDSRYAVIGLIPKSEIIASGWAIPFWHWKEVAKWSAK